jgi:hypothetical protein
MKPTHFGPTVRMSDRLPGIAAATLEDWQIAGPPSKRKRSKGMLTYRVNPASLADPVKRDRAIKRSRNRALVLAARA